MRSRRNKSMPRLQNEKGKRMKIVNRISWGITGLLMGFWMMAYILFTATEGMGANYYVSTSGNDAAAGSEALPWRSIIKASTTTLSSGDTVYFKGDDAWMDSDAATLIPQDGVTYGRYGTGANPRLTWAVNVTSGTSWTDLGGNIWATGTTNVVGPELCPNGSLDANVNGWSLMEGYGGSNGTLTFTNTAGEYADGTGGGKVFYDHAGTNLILACDNINVVAGGYYRIDFKAKSGASAFDISGFDVWSASGRTYLFDEYRVHPTVGTGWTNISYMFRAKYTIAATLQIYISLLAEGDTVYFDTVTIKRMADAVPLIRDVGNIWDGETSLTRVYAVGDLNAQGEFFHDRFVGTHNNMPNYVLKVYSTSNPTTYYGDLILDIQEMGCWNYSYSTGFSSVILQDLWFDHSMNGWDSVGTTNNFKALRNDISHTGGYWNGTVRGGGGGAVEGTATNVELAYNHIWESYDAGLSPQSSAAVTLTNIKIHDNLIERCEYGIETSLVNAGTVVAGMHILNNTIVDSGYQQLHAQRPDGVNSSSLVLGELGEGGLNISDLVVKNNIFYRSKERLLLIPDWADISGTVDLDNNLYYADEGNIVKSDGVDYATLALWKIASSKDVSSVEANPFFVNAGSGTSDFRLRRGSPAINAGVDVGLTTDSRGVPIQGLPDIGAYESRLVSVPPDFFDFPAMIFSLGPITSMGGSGSGAPVVVPPASSYLLFGADQLLFTADKLSF